MAQGLGMILPLFTPRVEKLLADLQTSWPDARDAATRHPQRWAHRRIDEQRFEKLEHFLARRVRKVWHELAHADLESKISRSIEQVAAYRSPRVGAAWLKSILLGWSTTHRLHRDGVPCHFCGAPGLDSQLHLLRGCPTLLALLVDAGVLPPLTPLLTAVALPASRIDVRVCIITHHLYTKVAFGGLSPSAALQALCREFPAPPPAPGLRRALRAML